MQNCRVNENGTLDITPAKGSSHRDFDFYEGKWNIRNIKLKDRLCNSSEWLEFHAYQEMKVILLGYGNTDNFITGFNDKPFEGRTLRLFNKATQLWSMYWTDSISTVLQAPTVGSFDGAIGKFYCLDTFEGQDIIVEFLWDKTDPVKPVWSQAFSVDKGLTWEVNWYMYMERSD